MRFIRDQCIEWCSPEFIEAAQQLKPKCLRYGIDLQIDWYAVWRAV